MTVYDDMRGFIHAHDRNGRFDVATETTPMYQMVDKAAAENAKLRELAEVLVNCGRKYHTMSGSCPMFDADAEDDDFCGAVQSARELGIEVKA